MIEGLLVEDPPKFGSSAGRGGNHHALHTPNRRLIRDRRTDRPPGGLRSSHTGAASGLLGPSSLPFRRVTPTPQTGSTD